MRVEGGSQFHFVVAAVEPKGIQHLMAAEDNPCSGLAEDNLDQQVVGDSQRVAVDLDCNSGSHHRVAAVVTEVAALDNPTVGKVAEGILPRNQPAVVDSVVAHTMVDPGL